MRADCYWMNMSDKPLSFFLDGMVRYSVAGYECLSLKPEEISRKLPEALVHSTHALVQLFMLGYPSAAHEEQKRLIKAFVEAGLLEKGSEPGSVFLTTDGRAILQAAGIAA